MASFILLVVAFAAFSLIVRAAQRRGVDDIAVGAVNYVVAAIVCWVIVALTRPSFALPAIGIGVLAGISYALGFVLLASTMKAKGAAITAAVMNLGVLVPILAAVVVWGERPGAVAIAGIALAVVAMPVLALDRGIDGEPLTARRLGVLLALFVANGAALAFADWFHSYSLISVRPLYVAILFTLAAVSAISYWLSRPERRLRRQELAWGAVLGVDNAAAALLTLYSLDAEMASVLFALVGALTLACVAIFAALVWREMPGRAGWIGLATAVAALVLAKL